MFYLKGLHDANKVFAFCKEVGPAHRCLSSIVGAESCSDSLVEREAQPSRRIVGHRMPFLRAPHAQAGNRPRAAQAVVSCLLQQ